MKKFFKWLSWYFDAPGDFSHGLAQYWRGEKSREAELRDATKSLSAKRKRLEKRLEKLLGPET